MNAVLEKGVLGEPVELQPQPLTVTESIVQRLNDLCEDDVTERLKERLGEYLAISEVSLNGRGGFEGNTEVNIAFACLEILK